MLVPVSIPTRWRTVDEDTRVALKEPFLFRTQLFDKDRELITTVETFGFPTGGSILLDLTADLEEQCEKFCITHYADIPETFENKVRLLNFGLKLRRYGVI